MRAFLAILALLACDDRVAPSRSTQLDVTAAEAPGASSSATPPGPSGGATASARPPLDLIDCARFVEVAREAGFRRPEREGDLLTLERGGIDCDHDSLEIERRASSLRAWRVQEGPHHRELRGPLGRGSVALRVNTVDAPTRADAVLLEQLRTALEGCTGR